jgi:replication factor C small subunit
LSEEKAAMWVEKYRPKTLDEVIDHKEIIARIKEFVKNPYEMPHLLFAGPPGNGKTTVATCIARELYGKNWRGGTLELNASDERGIDMVRDTIKTYARTSTIENISLRLIILDECDHMTSEAQTALRRIMEISSRTARFILICNYPSRIIEPIQSRCAIFRFPDLKKEDVINRLRYITEKEGTELTEDGAEAIWEFCNGDLRRAINMLQATAVLGKTITDQEVRKVLGKVALSEVKTMLNDAMSGNFLHARERLYDLIVRCGFSGVEIIRQISNAIYEMNMPDKDRAKLAEIIGEYEFRLIQGAHDDIQLSALLAQFSALKGK